MGQNDKKEMLSLKETKDNNTVKLKHLTDKEGEDFYNKLFNSYIELNDKKDKDINKESTHRHKLFNDKELKNFLKEDIRNKEWVFVNYPEGSVVMSDNKKINQLIKKFKKTIKKESSKTENILSLEITTDKVDIYEEINTRKGSDILESIKKAVSEDESNNKGGFLLAVTSKNTKSIWKKLCVMMKEKRLGSNLIISPVFKVDNKNYRVINIKTSDINYKSDVQRVFKKIYSLVDKDTILLGYYPDAFDYLRRAGIQNIIKSLGLELKPLHQDLDISSHDLKYPNSKKCNIL